MDSLLLSLEGLVPYLAAACFLLLPAVVLLSCVVGLLLVEFSIFRGRAVLRKKPDVPAPAEQAS